MTATSRERTSAVERLRRLDPVFSLADIETLFGFKRGQAYLYATRWATEGLTKRFGRGVYFNLIADPNASVRIPEAIDKLLRLPVLRVGASVLHDAGWTSQVYVRHDFAVPTVRGRLTTPTVSGEVLLTPRPAAWWQVLNAHRDDHGDAAGVMDVAPAMALADALLSQDLGGPARDRRVHVVPPDEIDMGTFTVEDLEAVKTCLEALGAGPDRIAALTAPYRDCVSKPETAVSW